MSYISYSKIMLEDYEFVAGSTQYLDFNLYNDSGVMVEVTGKELEWRLSPYGRKNYNSIIKTESEYVSEKDGNTYGGGVSTLDIYTKRVTLNPEDSELLSGKFIQQTIVLQTEADLSITTFKPAQGVITITSNAIKP